MLINKKSVKEKILEVGKEIHEGKLTRVSAPVFMKLEEQVEKVIRQYVLNHPLKGKTYMVYESEA